MTAVQMERVRYLIEPKISRLSVKVSAAGLLSALGHNPTIAARGVTGELDFAPADVGESALRFRVSTRTLSVQDDVNDQDRREIKRVMQDEVLESSRFPTIDFESTRVSATAAGDGRYVIDLSGRLTLHGVQRNVSIPAQIALTGGLLRAFGEFSLKQTDFGITLVSVAGGTLKVKDEVKFAFDMVARRQG
jgi:polyisoprenoid-binding protein YceI